MDRSARPWPLVGRDDALALARHAIEQRFPGVVVLVGRRGYGKSSTLAAIEGSARDVGHDVRRVIDRSGAAVVPTVERIAAAPTPGASGVLVTVDDADGMSDELASAVALAVGRGGARCVLTCDADRPLPPAFRALVSRGAALLTLGELGLQHVDELARAVLGRRISRAQSWAIWQQTGGRPSLVTAVLASGGTFTQDRREAPVPPAARRAALAELAGVSIEGRSALAAIAGREPLSLAVAESLFERRFIAELDDHHLLSVSGGDEPHVRVAVPLVAAALRVEAEGETGSPRPTAPSSGTARSALTDPVPLVAAGAASTVEARTAMHLLRGSTRRARAELEVLDEAHDAPGRRYERLALTAVTRALDADLDGASLAAHESVGEAGAAGSPGGVGIAAVVGATVELLRGRDHLVGDWLAESQSEADAGDTPTPPWVACGEALRMMVAAPTEPQARRWEALPAHGLLGCWTTAALLIASAHGAPGVLADLDDLVARSADAPPLVAVTVAYAAATSARPGGGADPAALGDLRRLVGPCDAVLLTSLGRFAIARASGDARQVGSAQRVLEQAGVGMRPGAGAPLTRREEDIGRLIAKGLPSKEIANELGLSRRTVDNALRRLFQKLDVKDRHQLRTHPAIQALAHR